MNVGLVFEVLGIGAGVLLAGSAIYAVVLKNEGVFKFTKALVILQAVFITISVVALVYALMTSDFRYVYVANYTDKSLPAIYKFCALWAGQAGSLLFWSWLASLCALVELFRLKDKNIFHNSLVQLVITVTATFFLFLATTVTSPFETLLFSPRDGNGLNPMLQNPGMMIHPPLLYIGFVGFTTVCAHAFASLSLKSLNSYWIKDTRGWTLVTWVFLTAGIVLGAWWAYVELGWGGYWAWDPVENASLFPWITATAYIHAALIFERKGRLRGWSYILILVTFELTIFGTFLTRSGIMTDSVHSFGTSPLGAFFVWFILFTAACYLSAFYRIRESIADTEEFNFSSREGVFFIGLLSFLALTIALIFYTMLPTLSELTGEKISMGQRPYNIVSIVFFTVIFLMASAAPLISYGVTEGKKFLRSYAPSPIVAFIVTAATVAFGFRDLAGIVLTFTVTAMLTSFLTVAAKALIASGPSFFIKNRRFTGSFIVHLGLALAAYGVIFSALYKFEQSEELNYNSAFTFGEYRVEAGKIESEKGANYDSYYLPLNISVKGKPLTALYPEIRDYPKSSNPYHEVAYYSRAKGDIYAALDGFDDDSVWVKVIFQPLIVWIWVGSILMCVGALYGAIRKVQG